MKYTVEGLQQSVLLEMNLDSVDAIILRYIIDFYNTGKMAKINDNGKEYFWINYSVIINEIPIINIKSNDSLYRRFRKYVKCNLMEHYTKKNGGTFSCYRFIENTLLKLISNSEGTDEKSDGYGLKVGQGTDEKSEQKILLLKDSSTNNPIAKKKKRVPIPVSENPPTKEEVIQYVKESNLKIDAEYFYDFFTTGNWIDSRGQVVYNWKQKAQTWNHSKDKQQPSQPKQKYKEGTGFYNV
jgi:hypothetical protein